MENPTTEDTKVPTTDAPLSEVPSAAPDIETKTYSDGTVATGVAPLPELSPAQQDAAAAALSAGTTVDVTQVGDQTVNTNVQNGNQLAGSGNVLVNETPIVDAPVLDGDTATLTNVENDLNPLVPAAGTEGAPASQLAAQAAEPEVEPLPRESHLMLLEAKFSAAVTKLRNAERVAVADLEAIWEHVKAVI